MFLYEMHQHTGGCSACSNAHPAQTVRTLAAEGFSGMVLTNHFLHGNTRVQRNIPWEDFVYAYEKEYLIAKAAGDALDFDVLFGMEEGVGGGKEVLLYGITPQVLYDHPELRGDSGKALLPLLSRVVHEAGGLVFQAHPFRNREYISQPWEPLPADYLDGHEVYNSCNAPIENARAAQLAAQTGLLTVAGSDAHSEQFPARSGIVCPHRICTEEMLAKTLRDREYTLHIPD